MHPYNLFPYYEKKDKKILSGKLYDACEFCKKNISDKSKKCRKFYCDIDLTRPGFIKCPYGLTVYVSKEMIFTCLLINGFDTRVKKNLKDEYKKIPKFNESELQTIIDYNVEQYNDNQKYRLSVHDIRNIAGNFNSVVDDFKMSKSEGEMTKQEKSLISLYELINLRLDVLYEKGGYVNTTISQRQKLHPLVVKLTYMLNYDARKKKCKIHVSANQNNSFKISKALYLVLYILLENAVKFALPNSCIYIDFIETNSNTKIVISNKSDKIIVEDKSLLLKKGFRGKNAKMLGSGIGLPFAKKMSNEMGVGLSIDIDTSSEKHDIFETQLTVENVI